MQTERNQYPSAIVVGTTFIDVKGFPFAPLNHRARNLGRVEFCHGGVGRNVAENLGYLGVLASFVSSVADNYQGREILEALVKAGVRTEHVVLADKSGIGIWQALLNAGGDVALSLSQMPDLGPMAEYLRLKGDEVFRQARCVVLEVDLNLEIVEMVLRLAERLHIPICGVPGNLDLILKHRELLGRLGTFICNQAEAELITGRKLDSIEQVFHAIESMRRAGPKNCVITMGGNGAVASGPDLQPAHYPVVPIDVVDTTGAGDAFVAGVVFGLTRGWKLGRSVRCAAKTAAWTVNTSESVNHDLKRLAFHDPDFRD